MQYELYECRANDSFNCEYEVEYSSRTRSLFNLRGGNVLLNFNGYTVVAENMIYERGFMEFLDNGRLVGEVSNIYGYFSLGGYWDQQLQKIQSITRSH